MKLKIDGLDVYFPFSSVHPEQYEYMKNLRDILDSGGSGIIEMPTGTGKTASLFALCLSYKQSFPDNVGKIVYCTRTISQLEKATKELRGVENVLKNFGIEPPRAVALSSRRTLCINEKVNVLGERNKVDSLCQKLTRFGLDGKCSYYENMETGFLAMKPNSHTLNIEDLLDLGRKNTVCPYFTARRLLSSSDVVLCNYPYILDESSNSVLTSEIPRNSIIIIDEAHNLDDVCIDSKSSRIDKFITDQALKSLDSLTSAYDARKLHSKEIFEQEYTKLLSRVPDPDLQSKLSLSNPQNVPTELFPGSIRRVPHFLAFVKRIIGFLVSFLKQKDSQVLTPAAFLNQLTQGTLSEPASLLFAQRRLNSLLPTLQFHDSERLISLTQVLSFLETMATYDTGFEVVFEPLYDTGKFMIPVLQLVCLDSSIAMKGVLALTPRVILTSGTISPLEMYARVLAIKPFRMISIQPRWTRNCINPLIVSRANDQSPITSEFLERANSAVSKNYGDLLKELARFVPDGIVSFFPSYGFLESLLTDWNKIGVIEELLKYKLIFIETKDRKETAIALQNYKLAIEKGRGAIFCCIARGKVAEGVDFKDHLGRCALVIGIPFQYSRSRALICRMDFLEKQHGISQREFLVFDAMKQTAQCLGRIMRGKSDYGIMVLADRRFNAEKIDVLPLWIRNFVKAENMDLQINLSICLVKKFFIEMAESDEIDGEMNGHSNEINNHN